MKLLDLARRAARGVGLTRGRLLAPDADLSKAELGCGHGRTARGLLDWLRAPGRYAGRDVDRRRLDDARERIGRRHPNLAFHFADVRNSHYNAHETASASTYALPDEVHNNPRESTRVLKPGGRRLFSVFLLDHYRGTGTTISPLYEFHPHLGPVIVVRDPAHPDALVGYSLAWISASACAARLRVVRVLPGLWSNSPCFAVNEQDLLLLASAA